MRAHAIAAIAALALISCTKWTSFHQVTDGDVVKFQPASSTPISPDWMKPDFDDSSWRSGPQPVGIGKQVSTKIDGMGSAFVTLYVRVPFDLGPGAAQTTHLTISSPVTGGGYVLYVNGVEVGRDAVPDGTRADQPATGEAAVKQLSVDVPAGTLRPSGNVVAVEAHCPTNASDVSVGFTLDADTPPTVAGIIRGPYLQMLRSDGVTVVFDTAESVPAMVVVDGRSVDGQAATHHEIAVDGLAAGTAYPYHVEAGTSRSEDLELTTAPGPGETVTFLVYGDSRTNGDVHRRVARAMAAEGVDVALNTGDMVAAGGDDGEWDDFFAIEYPLLTGTAMYPAMGNHETDGSGGVDRFKAAFDLPENQGTPAAERVYSFDVGDVHFAALDSNLSLAQQADWVAQDTTAARGHGARHVFWYIHHGPYSAGTKHGSSAVAQQYLAPIARQLHVDAIFGGHDHIYERGLADGLHYFVTGGAGAPLYSVNPLPSTQYAEARTHYMVVTVGGDHVHVEAKDPDGHVFDTADW